MFAIIFVMIIGTFVGCSAVDAKDASPFAVYRSEDNLKIGIGDKQTDIETLFDNPVPEHIVEFFEEKVNRYKYWDNDEIAFDYDADGVTRAIRFESDKWKLANGLTVGNLAKEVEAKYPKEFVHKYTETEDIWIAYDKDGNTIKFTEQCPYVVRFAVTGGKVERICVQDNTARGTIF